MIPKRMERTVRGVGRQAYTAAVTDLWERVAIALARLARLRGIERARVRACARPPDEVESPHGKAPDRIAPSAIVATALTLGGAFLFTAGAVLGAWPVWAAGLALFAGGFILYRP